MNSLIRHIILILLCVFVQNISYAQSKELDSLNSMLKTAKHDTTLYNAFMGFGKYFQSINPDKAIYFHNKAEKISNANGNLMRGEALRSKGWDNYVKSDYDKALSFYDLSFKISDKYVSNPEKKITQTDLILNRVREIVIEKLTGQDAIRDGMDICLIRIEKGSNTIQYSGANRPLWYIENNTLIETKGDKKPIGKYEEAKPFTSHNIQLSNNSTLYLSTDGYADQFGGERGKKISVKALKEKLLQVAHKNIQEQYNELLGFYTNWKGTIEQIDDVTVIGISL